MSITKDKAKEILSKLQIMHPNAGCELIYTTPYELLVAVILSAQCTDKRVNEVTKELFKVYNTAEQISELTVDQLKPYIFSCGFYNNKGKNIIDMSKDLVAKYNGEVPRDFDSLVALAGVGRKTASVVLSVAFDIPAMPVDTHVNRVSKRIGFSEGSTVEKVEEDLRNLFDKEDWNSLHHSMIFHGRYVCNSRKPNCNECLIKDDCTWNNTNEEDR